MYLHICKSKPCPIEEKEYFDVFNNGFTTSFVDLSPKDKMLDLSNDIFAPVLDGKGF